MIAPMPLSPFPCRRFAAGLIASAGLARAEAPQVGCEARVVSASLSAEWRTATERLAQRLRRLGEPHDCGEVTVEVPVRGAATLRFRTRDGREASRSVAVPRELEATVDALLIMRAEPPAEPAPAGTEVAPAPGAPDAVQPSAVTASAGASVAPVAPVAPVESSSPVAPLGLVVAALVGPRLAVAPGAFVSPNVTLRANALIGAWDAGLVIDAAPHYVALGSAPDGFTLDSYALGFSFGRREAFGALTFAYAGTVALHAIRESVESSSALVSSRFLDTVQPRAGAVAQAIWPLTGASALVLAWSADVALAGFRDAGTADRELPTFARVGTALALGLEAKLR